MKAKDWLAFILLGLIWGSSFLWIKIAVREVSPVLLVAFRLLFGILGLLVVAAIARPVWPRQRSIWLILTLIGFTNNAIPYVLISWGEKYIDSAVAAILNSTTPLFTMVLAYFFLSEDRVTPGRLVALLTGFVGIVLLVSRDLAGPGISPQALGNPYFSLFGTAAVLLACVFYAFSAIYARRTTHEVAPQMRVLIPLFGADLALWAVTSVETRPLALPGLPLTWVAMVWLGILGVAVASSLYYYLLHSVGPTRAALVTYVFPLVGVALGVIFLDERLDWNLAAGATLIVGSIIVVNR